MLIFDIGYYWLVFLAFILGRYFLMAGGVFYLFHPVARSALLNRQKVPSQQDTHQLSRRWRLIRHDISLSISAAIIFALFAALLMMAYNAGQTRIYSDIETYGWWYMGLSFVLTLMLQDTYFYFTHRLIHHPRWFQRIHQGHHRSRLPTPWTSFAFDPSETLIHGIFFVGLVFAIPLHFATLIAVFVTMTLWAIATHLGFELISQHHPLHRLSRGLIGPLHHGIHHRQYQVHFGLYFTFWDRVCHTTDAAYLQRSYDQPPDPELNNSR